MTSSLQRLSEDRWRPLITVGLMLLLPAIAFRRAVLILLLQRPSTCGAFNGLMIHDGIGAYNRGALALNYFEHGFIRRGLGGTLLELIGRTPPAACIDKLLLFHFASALWVAIPLALLASKAIRDDHRFGLWLAVLLAASPQLFLAWGGDLGRIDMFVEGCIAWSVLALLRGNRCAAVAALLVGLLAHENAVIYGAPLLAGLALEARSRAQIRSFYRPAAALLVGIILLALAHQLFTTASTQDIVNSVLRSQSPSDKRDFAAYIAVSGGRGILTSLCASFGRPATPLYLAVAILFIALYAWLLRIGLKRKVVLTYALVTVLPFLAVSLVAIDYGRWLTYAIVNAWLFSVGAGAPHERRSFSARTIVPRVIVLAGLIAMRPSHVHLPTYFVKAAAERLWTRQAIEVKPTYECDPTWRESIGLSPVPDYAPPAIGQPRHSKPR